jgi:hypothetical protein
VTDEIRRRRHPHASAILGGVAAYLLFGISAALSVGSGGSARWPAVGVALAGWLVAARVLVAYVSATPPDRETHRS